MSETNQNTREENKETDSNIVSKVWYKSKVIVVNTVTLIGATLPTIVDFVTSNPQIVEQFGKPYYLALITLNTLFNTYKRVTSENIPIVK